MSDAIDKIQLPDGYHVKQYSGPTLPDRTGRFSMKWDGEWHITVEVFRDLGLAFAAVLVLIYVLVVGWFHIYGPATTEHRGGTVTFNLYDPQGHLLDYGRIEELAGEEGISLRTGCFCNPGAGEMAEELTEEDMQAGLAMEPDINLFSFVRLMQDRSHKSAGSIRASIGLASNFPDILRFLRFITGFRDQTRLTIGDGTFDIESCRIIRDGS